ncbi:hypothetical protein SSX86_016552 [Deinandra increscens subsp. villosa]|uniref:Reverse transcriptase domain-containing protein n=1 Tax=Deinandra increscens subsp. villosa TaxID=3103831 RepID=A0AAP0D5N4_9ASTR
MGFSAKWVSLIKACLDSATSSVLINGSPTKEFKVERGLRQGDPLSPFLFILAMEGLNYLINEEVKGGRFKPMLVGRNKVALSHLFYADDVIFIGEWSQSNLEAIFNILNIFKEWSGLQINSAKSNLFGWGIPAARVANLASVSGCKVGSTPFVYLGVPVGDNMRSIKAWEPIINKFKSRLSKWKANLLSIGGRMTLVSSVLGSLSTYFLSIFRIPKQVDIILEGLRAKFFWGSDDLKRRMHWVKWDIILASKKKGGLGIGSLDALNQALLLKWKWRLVSNKDQVWVNIIESIFHIDPLSARPYSSGGVWKFICKSSNYLHDNDIIPSSSFKKVIGRGDSTAFWTDIWLGELSLAYQFPRLFALEMKKECCIMERLGGTGCWMWRRPLRGGIESVQFDRLCALLNNQSLGVDDDSWQWNLDGESDFIVKNVRHRIDDHKLPSLPLSTRWNKWIPKKINICIWRLLLNRLPVRSNLIEKDIPIRDLGCVLCDSNFETSLHVFSRCPVFNALWRDIKNWLLIDGPSDVSPLELLDWVDKLVVSPRWLGGLALPCFGASRAGQSSSPNVVTFLQASQTSSLGSHGHVTSTGASRFVLTGYTGAVHTTNNSSGHSPSASPRVHPSAGCGVSSSVQSSQSQQPINVGRRNESL